jgi:hypothetical protein
MRRGNDQQGFTVELDPQTNVVHVSAWGFWGSDVAAAFPEDVLEVSADARPGFGLLFDCGSLPPQRAEGQEAWSRLVRELDGEVGPVCAVVPNAVTKLQLVRISKVNVAHRWSFFSTVAAAMLSLEHEDEDEGG